jgi:Spy/CpxP family protein refolding chaperone
MKGDFTMKTTKILASAFAVALLLAAALVLQAQGPAFHRHMDMSGDMMARHEAFLTKALNLTAAQQASLKQLHADLAAKAKPLMDQQSQQWQDLHTLLASDNPDATEVGQAMIAVHATGRQLKALHDDFKTKFSALLTPDQLEKFNQFMQREHGPFGGPFGGPPQD